MAANTNQKRNYLFANSVDRHTTSKSADYKILSVNNFYLLSKRKIHSHIFGVLIIFA